MSYVLHVFIPGTGETTMCIAKLIHSADQKLYNGSVMDAWDELRAKSHDSDFDPAWHSEAL